MISHLQKKVKDKGIKASPIFSRKFPVNLKFFSCLRTECVDAQIIEIFEKGTFHFLKNGITGLLGIDEGKPRFECLLSR